MFPYSAVPQQLKDLPNWVGWKLDPDDKGNLTKKVPYIVGDPNERKAKADDSTTWTTFAQASDAADILNGGDYAGIGFELGGTDIAGIDFDGAIADTGVIDPYVLAILKLLGNPYTETSPSGKGLHAFVRCAALPAGGRKMSKGHEGVEIYHGREGGRYFTVTSERVLGDGVPVIADMALPYLLLTQNKNKKFKSLWCGDTSAYGGDDSSADFALMCELARLTKCNPGLMETYFSFSGLAQRDKWGRKDYRDRTIKAALVGKDAQNPTQTAVAATGTLKLNLVSLADITAEIQEWLWLNRFPKNALTNLSGDADKGKSLVLYDVMARLSNGAAMPDGSPNPFGGEPKKVILLFSEGSLTTTVKPRMMVMNANMANVIAVKSVSCKGETDPEKRQFSLEHDLARLRQALQENPEVVFIGFDPITNYLGDKCNMNRSQDVRRVLTPLGELAEDCAVTVVAIIHFNKNRDMSAMHRTGGAAALVEVPRAAWCCLPDDDPDHKGGYVFVPIKNNLGKRIGGRRYTIEETFIEIQGQQASEPHLIWGDVTEKTADDILGAQVDPELKGIDKAKRWLDETFKDGMARRSAAMYSAALTSGITEDCLKKARRFIRLDNQQRGGVWYTRRHQKDTEPWRFSTDLEERLAAAQEDNSDEKSVTKINRAESEEVGTLNFRSAEVRTEFQVGP